jgi:hypothetical protein
MVCIGCADSKPVPPDPAKLSEVIFSDDTETMARYLDAGLALDLPHPELHDSPPLHYAAFSGSEKIVQLLLERGANRNAIDGIGLRPIDWAYDAQKFGVCEILKVTGPSGPLETELLRSIFTRPVGPAQDNGAAIFVSINGKKPTPEQIAILGFPEERVSLFTVTAPFDSKTNKMGEVFRITFTKISETEYRYNHVHHIGNGNLSGGGSNGTLVLAYGYWIVTERDGFIS